MAGREQRKKTLGRLAQDASGVGASPPKKESPIHSAEDVGYLFREVVALSQAYFSKLQQVMALEHQEDTDEARALFLTELALKTGEALSKWDELTMKTGELTLFSEARLAVKSKIEDEIQSTAFQVKQVTNEVAALERYLAVKVNENSLVLKEMKEYESPTYSQKIQIARAVGLLELFPG